MNNVSILNPPFVLKSLKWPITLRMFWIFNILLLIFLLIFYVFQVNAETSERYLIQEYEKGVSDVSRENKNLEISSVQLNSLGNITALLEGLKFEKIDKIYYIQILNDQMVSR